FESDRDGDFEIFVVNADGSGLTQLTSNTATDGMPSISDDGSKIAYQSYVDGDAEIVAWMIRTTPETITKTTDETTAETAITEPFWDFFRQGRFLDLDFWKANPLYVAGGVGVLALLILLLRHKGKKRKRSKK
ncbi:MAG: TolB family protein, partial [Candidatus Hodarchaeota archaeon]